MLKRKVERAWNGLWNGNLVRRVSEMLTCIFLILCLSLRWIVDMEGASGTLYEGEKFQLLFKFSSRYPFDSPQVSTTLSVGLFVVNVCFCVALSFFWLSPLFEAWSDRTAMRGWRVPMSSVISYQLRPVLKSYLGYNLCISIWQQPWYRLGCKLWLVEKQS